MTLCPSSTPPTGQHLTRPVPFYCRQRRRPPAPDSVWTRPRRLPPAAAVWVLATTRLPRQRFSQLECW
jgi:hypothetical protein